MNKAIVLFLLIFLISCKETATERMTNLVKEWDGKEIFFPSHMYFTVLGQDTVKLNFMQRSNYSIVTYVDSIGCMSCKLKLDSWENLIQNLDSITSSSVPVYFFLHPNSTKSMKTVLKKYNFTYPVCIDEKDSFNILNHFPSDMMFQTFLLNGDNKVVAIGNPVNNPKIKELFLNIITGSSELIEATKQPNTTVLISDNRVNMGDFSWNKRQEKVVTISNTGNIPLVINDVITSCGCITVEYNKEPAQPGKNASIKIVYKADHPEHFNKTIAVYCNAKNAPLQLEISGNAK